MTEETKLHRPTIERDDNGPKVVGEDGKPDAFPVSINGLLSTTGPAVSREFYNFEIGRDLVHFYGRHGWHPEQVYHGQRDPAATDKLDIDQPGTLLVAWTNPGDRPGESADAVPSFELAYRGDEATRPIGIFHLSERYRGQSWESSRTDADGKQKVLSAGDIDYAFNLPDAAFEHPPVFGADSPSHVEQSAQDLAVMA